MTLWKVDYTDVEPTIVESAPEISDDFQNWKRPPLMAFNPSQDSLVFQQIDIDHYIGDAIPELMPAGFAGNAKVPVVRMYGILKNENSIMVNVYGFMPYFYIKLGPSFRADNLEAFRKSLNAAVQSDKRSQMEGISESVLSVCVEKKESMYGFNDNIKSNFLKITVAVPRNDFNSRRCFGEE
ncbi:DNA polymerase delta catalytic subunit [Halotydeus destructor]|nr:DNA polymerase delta catalytic subunit [Halotydeus destructor]